MKKALLVRFGGIGDNAPMGVVGAQLKAKGYHVTAAFRESPGSHLTDVYRDNPCFDELLDIQMMGPWESRCVRTQIGFCTIQSIYRDFDLVLDYMNIVENNNTSPKVDSGPANAWQSSRNSNFSNWYDMHLAWANIDPSKLSDAEKTPKFYVTEKETANFAKLKKHYSHLIVIQASASSISRTWFQAKELPELIINKYPEALVALWEPSMNSWVLISKKEITKLDGEKGCSIRESMALISLCDLFIGADSGFSHIAEGLGVKNIAVYSTVPAWTRNKYYTNQIAVDPGEKNPEFYTFSLGLGDPLRTLEGENNYTERDKLIVKLRENKATSAEASAALNTDEEGARLELEAFLAKQASFERQQSKALSSVSAKEVFRLVEGVLK